MTMTATPPPYSEVLSGPVERIMSYILNKYARGLAPLYVPQTPSWEITPYNQERMVVWEALNRFVMQIGWDLRWRWLGPNRGQLTLFEPPRAQATPVWTFEDSDYFELAGFDYTTENVRNVVFVGFGPAAARTQVRVSDEASVSRWRYPRVMWLEESSESPLQTEAEATRMAQAALRDLAQPKLSMTMTLPFFPWLELHDVIKVRGNSVHFDNDFVFTVAGITHSFAGGRATTELSLRDGGAASGEARWLRREYREGVKYL